MNLVALIGRLTKDPQISYSASNLCIANFTVAVDRPYKKDGESSADFISCRAFGGTAEFLEKYFKKGMKIALKGEINAGNYEKDGKKIYYTIVKADSVEFVEKKAEGAAEQTDVNGFMQIKDGVEDELPFA